MKLTKKIILCILLVTMIFTFASPILVNAASESWYQDPKSIKAGGSLDAETEIALFGHSIVRILTTVGIVLSVIVLIVIGIKYMMGSAEEKAEYKKTMMPYLIGALLIFAASVIANIVYGFFSSVS